MRDLEEMFAKLLEAVRKLPPRPERYELLRELGRFRVKMDAIALKGEQTTLVTKVAGR
jgi:hypothetical protein